MKLTKGHIVFITVLGIFLLASCSGKEENTETTSEESGEQISAAEEGHQPIEPEHLGKAVLAEEVESVYKQTSTEFQNEVSLAELEDIITSFNKGVEEYELQSEIPIDDFIQYTWVDDSGTKGMMAVFDEEQTIAGLQVLPLQTFPETDEQYTETEFILPIQEEWFTFWGGTNELLNYHYAHENQRYAIDLLMMRENQTFEGNPTENESYFAFGKELIAPATGEVVQIENQIADNEPVGEMNAEEPFGNYVMLDHGNDEYSVIAHMKQDSIQVEVGDKVEQGDLLGLCGNSGNSSEPHIHFHVQDSPDLGEGTSVRIQFQDDVNPTRGDRVQPAD